VRSQARDRLFYVMPGETQLGVVDDVVLPVESDEETSPELSRIESDWVRGIAASFLTAGTTDAPLAELEGSEPVPLDPAATETEPTAEEPQP
jgi:hypothetical protein